ncbi:MAG: NYN domain-containing protein [Candidatus Peregrinibacteria bacterium]
MADFFHLKGPTIALIDWANIFHVQEKNGWEVDLAKLHALLRSHSQVHDIVLFHGRDTHPKSVEFLAIQAKTGYRIVTKDVKLVRIMEDSEGNTLPVPLLRRKCDFDVEISMEILLNLDRFYGFILFSGDGDYAPIFDVLRERRKQAILVFPQGSKGREYEENIERNRGMFLCSLERLRSQIAK